jgi:hypothetical protein
MSIALVSGIVGRWAHERVSVPSAATVVKVVFAVVVIAALDQGDTQPIARGFAWLFLVGVLLGKNSPIEAIGKAAAKTPKGTK